MNGARHRVSLLLAGLAAGAFLGWLGPALLGVQPRLAPGVELGHWANVRLAAWLLLAAALLHPRREAWLVPLERALEGRARWAFPLALSAFAVAFKVTQHLGFGTGAYDLSMYHSAVRHAWADGPGFMWAFGIERNFMAEHFSPVLLLFVPFDFIFRSPLVLLVGEGLLFGLGAFTLSGLARALGLRPVLAQGLALVYATNVVCWDALTFDFHPESFLPTALFGALWALKARRGGWLVVSLLFVLSIKEDVALMLLPMVALVWLDERAAWRWPLAVAVFTTAWFLFAVRVAMPLARPPGEAWGMFAARYGQWGPTPGAAALAMFSRPGEVLELLFARPVNYQLKQLAYVPALDPLGLLASVPALLEQRLSNYEAQYNLGIYYGIGVVAVWLLAMIRAARWVERKAGFVAGVLLVSAPVLYHPHTRVLTAVTAQDLEDARLLAATVPAGADVLAQTSLVPQLPISPKVKLFPGAAVDFVVLRPSGFRWPASDAEYRAAVLALLDEGGFGVAARTSTLVILRKGAAADQNAAVKALISP